MFDFLSSLLNGKVRVAGHKIPIVFDSLLSHLVLHVCNDSTSAFGLPFVKVCLVQHLAVFVGAGPNPLYLHYDVRAHFNCVAEARGLHVHVI